MKAIAEAVKRNTGLVFWLFMCWCKIGGNRQSDKLNRRLNVLETKVLNYHSKIPELRKDNANYI